MLNCLYAGRFGLGWAHNDITVARHMLMHFHAYVLYIQYISIYLNYFWDFSECFFLPPHSLVYVSASWHQNISLHRLGTLFILGHLRLLNLPLLLFNSVMSKLEKTSQRDFLNEVFIRNAESSCRTSPTLTYPQSFIVEVGSHCVTSRSPVLLCWSWSSTPTCMDWIILFLFFILVFEVRV